MKRDRLLLCSLLLFMKWLYVVAGKRNASISTDRSYRISNNKNNSKDSTICSIDSNLGANTIVTSCGQLRNLKDNNKLVTARRYFSSGVWHRLPLLRRDLIIHNKLSLLRDKKVLPLSCFKDKDVKAEKCPIPVHSWYRTRQAELWSLSKPAMADTFRQTMFSPP
ncbi:hypothetical protein RRG08_002002 [Elysia crispata]|uniref:Uncharacterized protein n=1 Tax=Elysia crispata TaxID=231223 RepID=A0AAE1EDI4_9GAST|nr:hypothetical protein RRG08_002002 [Elysia crispata]